MADASYGSEENYIYIHDILDKTPLITYSGYHKESKKTTETILLSLKTDVIWKKKLSDEKTGSIYRKRKIKVEPVFGHLKADLTFHRFHLRGKQGAKIDVGLALMALNLRKLGKYMERRKEEKNKLDFDINHQNQTCFLFESGLCPTLIFVL